MFHEFDELAKSMDEVIKAGEGSHGGKVIGHTKSGKPIYQSKMQHIDSGVHSSYTARDHKDAAHAHPDPAMKHFHENWQKLKGNPLNKSLTFDPFSPHEMNSESSYYNPYRFVDGGYMPHPTSYWREQGKREEIDNYHQTNIYFEKYGNRSNALKSFAETVGEDLIKAGAVPIGTVHTYKNGDKFKKVGEGRWQPVGEVKAGQAPTQKTRDIDHDQTEKDAQKISDLRDAIKNKYAESGTEQKHTAATHAQLKEFAHAVFGDELPDGVKAHLDKKEKELGKPNVPAAMQKPIKEIQRHFTKKHHVSVTFKVNGQTYKHDFKDVTGDSQDAVQAQITDMLKKKIPGATITRIHTEKSKEDIDAQKNNYQKELKGDKDGSAKQTRV